MEPIQVNIAFDSVDTPFVRELPELVFFDMGFRFVGSNEYRIIVKITLDDLEVRRVWAVDDRFAAVFRLEQLQQVAQRQDNPIASLGVYVKFHIDNGNQVLGATFGGLFEVLKLGVFMLSRG